MPERFEYDVFLSHSSKDKSRVRRLAKRMRDVGLRVWFDEWIIKAGDDRDLAIERGLEKSRVQVLCLSPAALDSDWVRLERNTVLFRDPTNRDRRFIPLLLTDCDLRDTLRRSPCVDFREETRARFDELVAACRTEPGTEICDRRHGVSDGPILPAILPSANKPTHPQAFLVSASGPMLRREKLAEEDFRDHKAVEPPQVKRVVDALTGGKNVAAEGPPGTGKSALAAWVNWTGVSRGARFAAFFGSELQQTDPESGCHRIEHVADDHILIIDDIHLLDPLFSHLVHCPWASERRFFLLGRSPYVEKARRKSHIPRIDELVRLNREDSQSIAERLAYGQLRKEAGERLLTRTGRDLVFTKWLLEAVTIDGVAPNSTPSGAAVEKLDALRKGSGSEFLRLFLTLAVFGWAEFWCSEAYLVDVLHFRTEEVSRIVDPLGEAERTRSPGEYDGFALRLMRHPSLCELFVHVAPQLGCVFGREVLGPTCEALGLEERIGRKLGFGPLILGAALAHRVADFDMIQSRLVYGGRSQDFARVAMAAAEIVRLISPANSGRIPDPETQALRLRFAFGAANGERRLHGGRKAGQLLDALRRSLGVHDIPDGPFQEKGFILYQDAYLLRLGNAGTKALQRFQESAMADDEWAGLNSLPFHSGKAAMSRIAASAYRIDLVLFGGPAGLEFQPRHADLDAIRFDLRRDIRLLDQLIPNADCEHNGRMLRSFRNNGLLHLAECCGWAEDSDELESAVKALGEGWQSDEHTQYAIGLSRGALLIMQSNRNPEGLEQAIHVLEGQPEKRAETMAGEGAGKVAAMLVLAYAGTGRQADAERMREWILSGECLLDSGNGLAKRWAEAYRRVKNGDTSICCNDGGESPSACVEEVPIEITRQDVIEGEGEPRAARQQSRFEQAVARIRTYVDGEKIKIPECFISYAWGADTQERWVEKRLAKDLQKAGIRVVLDKWENSRVGVSVSRFIERIEKCDRILVVGTPDYLRKYENKDTKTGYVVAAEVDLIAGRLLGTEPEKETVMPLLLLGEEASSLPPLLRRRVFADFRDDELYFVTAFDLLLDLYGIGHADKAVEYLRENLERKESR